MENFHGWRPSLVQQALGSMGSWYGNSGGRCALFTCVEYNVGAGSAKKVGWRDTGRLCKRHSRYRREGGQLFQSLDTGRVSARHYSPDSNIACRFASDVPWRCQPQRNVYNIRTYECVRARASVFEESRNGSWRRDVSNYDTASVPEYRVE